jgi:hydrogenase/urease accessory protein HupE
VNRCVARQMAVLMALSAWAGSPCSSHEVRPALLQLTERGDNHFDVLWKQPSMGALAVHLVPHLSGDLLESAPSSVESAPDFEIHRWRNLTAGQGGLEGRTVWIEGLDRTITDVLVSITLPDGKAIRHMLNPQDPSLTLHLAQGQGAAWDFLMLGVRHILTGPDHLLFLLALLLIVRDRWMLLKTVSAFTLAHSLTLAAATLGELPLSTPLLNALIALSILFIAPEAVRAQRGGFSLTVRYPWIVAFSFGLLHGMGFATGLSALGLGRGALASALVLFNVGVEIGQVAFIALVLALQRAFRLMEFDWPRPVAFAPAYLIGIVGAFWTFLYSAAALGIP